MAGQYLGFAGIVVLSMFGFWAALAIPGRSSVVLENIFRHMEMGESPEVVAEKGGQDVALPVLAATLTTIVVFFPAVLSHGYITQPASRFDSTALPQGT